MAAPVLAVLLVVNALAFVVAIENNVVQNDWWRFVHLIDVYESGEMDLEALLEPTNHPSILVPLCFLADQVFLSMELRLPLYLPFVFWFAAVFLVTRHCHGVLTRVSSSPGLALMALPLAGIVAPCEYSRMFINGPVAFNVLRVSCYLMAFLFVQRVARKNSVSLADVVSTALLIPCVVLVVGQGSGLIFALALLVTLCFIAAEKRSTGHLVFCAVAAAVAIGSMWVFTAVLMEPSRTPFTARVKYVLDHPVDAGVYVLHALSTSVLGPYLRTMVPLKLAIGAVVAIAYALTLWECLRRRLHRHTYLPLALMTHSLLFIALVMISRLPTQVSLGGAAARYYPDTHLGILGICLALAALHAMSTAADPPSFRFSRRWRAAALGVVFTALLTVQGFVLHRQWTLAGPIKARFDRVRATLIHADELSDRQLIRRLRVRRDFFHRYVPEAIDIMRRRKLNVFAGDDSR